jgi:hypothetical protein
LEPSIKYIGPISTWFQPFHRLLYSTTDGFSPRMESTLHNEMGTWGAPMAVIYVPGVRIYAQRYFSALKVLIPPVSQMPDPGVRTIRILPVSDA